MAYKGDAFDPASTDFAAATVFGDLAFGETSDIYKKLYIQEQRVDEIGASIPLNRDMPLFEISARIKKEEDLPRSGKRSRRRSPRSSRRRWTPADLPESRRGAGMNS